jgi:hypothetical protein
MAGREQSPTPNRGTDEKPRDIGGTQTGGSKGQERVGLRKTLRNADAAAHYQKDRLMTTSNGTVKLAEKQAW